MAATEPGASSPAIGQATGCTRRFTGRASRTRPLSEGIDDGLRLRDAYVTAVNRCAPPGNRPTPTERDNCLPYLVEELRLLGRAKVLVALGSFAWDGALRALRRARAGDPPPQASLRPRRGGAVGGYALLGCYHPSQQNTFTGRLTEAMLDDLFARARELT